MPARNWGQQGSFIVPVAPPLLGPGEGTLVQLPCINQDWVLLLMGCVEQLRNPSTWLASLSDSARDLVLSRVEQLQELIWSGMDVPCCNVMMRLNGSSLQFSTDGGMTWTTVSGWDAGFCPAVNNCVIPAVPPNPAGTAQPQHACNMAGFLAQEVMQKTMHAMIAFVGTSNEQAQFAIDLASALAGVFPITWGVSSAAYRFYQDTVSVLTADITAASTDPVLLSAITCAIYDAIAADGYITPGNFAQVGINLHSILSAYLWAPNALGNYWNEVGLTNWQSAQAVGAIADEDCTDCGTWCGSHDFTTGGHGWAVLGGSFPYGQLTASGWEGTYRPGPNVTQMDITYFFSSPVQITNVCIFIRNATVSTILPNNRAVELLVSGSNVNLQFFPDTSFPIRMKLCAFHGNIVADQIIISWIDDGNSPFVIDKVEVYGSGTQPAGFDVCTE